MAKIRVLFQYADLNNPSFPNLQNFVKSLDKDAVIFRNLSTSTFISKMQSIWKDSSGKLHPAFIGVNSGLGTRIVIGQEVLPGEFRVAMVQDFEPNYDTNYISQWYWHVINRIFPLKYFCESDFTIGSVKANSPAYDSAFDTEAEAKENCKPIILAKVRYLVDSDGAIISVSENDPDYLKAYATKEEALKNKPSSKTTMYLIGGAAVLAILLFLRKK